MAEIFVNETQNGASLRVGVGDILVIDLRENPTTGYRWLIDEATGVTPVGDEFSAISLAPGAGGKRKLSFIAPTPGLFHIQASLCRSWEQAAAPQAQFRVTIQVC